MRSQHIYADISHFRAPYENVAVRGLGAVVNQGALPPPPADPGTVTPDAIAAVTDVGPDGIRRYKPEVRELLMKQLEGWKQIFLTATNVKVVPMTEQELSIAQTDPKAKQMLEDLSAAKWVRQKVAEGLAIYAPYSLVWPTEAMLQSGTGIQLGAMPPEPLAMKAASEVPIGAFLAEPPTVAKPAGPAEAKVSPALIAVGVVAALGAGAYVLTKMTKRKGRPGALRGTLA